MSLTTEPFIILLEMLAEHGFLSMNMIEFYCC